MIQYWSHEFKSKQDVIDAYDEVNAILELNRYMLDSKEELVPRMISSDSEDAYYEETLNALEYLIDNWELSKVTISKDKKEHSQHKHFHNIFWNKQKGKEKISNLYNKLQNKKLNPIYLKISKNNKSYLKRYYRGSRSKYLKKIGHKKERANQHYFPKGNKSKRQFDFWYELY